MRDGSRWQCANCGNRESSPIDRACPGCGVLGDRYLVESGPTTDGGRAVADGGKDRYRCACGRQFDRQVAYAGHRSHCDAEDRDRDGEPVEFDLASNSSSLERARTRDYDVQPLPGGSFLVEFETGESAHEAELSDVGTNDWRGDCWILEDGKRIGRCRGWVYHPGPCAHLWAVRSELAALRLTSDEPEAEQWADHPHVVEHHGDAERLSGEDDNDSEARFDWNENGPTQKSVGHTEGSGFYKSGATPPRDGRQGGLTRERVTQRQQFRTGRTGGRGPGFSGGGWNV